MYFKAMFNEIIDETNYPFDEVEISNITGKEILQIDQYEFEIERNNDNLIDGLTFCNQCTNTYGIESEFIKLLIEILPKEGTVKLFDSNGLTSDFNHEDLEEYIS
ncbi:MAG: hypothetical protein OQJ81_00875 [Melioribacteraceae bacterium]|nr:hypothetical protein [Melioribacteraceae bacterium]